MTQTLEQRRAAHALKRVKKHMDNGDKDKSEGKKIRYGNYVAYVSSLPATILMNGLGQACATLLSQKEKAGHKQLFEDVQDWLCGDEAAPYRNAAGGDTKLMTAITESNQDDYFRAQAEALAYLVWLKKLAKAFLDAGRPE